MYTFDFFKFRNELTFLVSVSLSWMEDGDKGGQVAAQRRRSGVRGLMIKVARAYSGARGRAQQNVNGGGTGEDWEWG